MNLPPKRFTDGDFIKGVAVFAVVFVILASGSVVLLELGSTDRTTITFENDNSLSRLAVTGMKYQTPDARSGNMVITNFDDPNSEAPAKPLRIKFWEPKEIVSVAVATPDPNGGSGEAFGLDCNGERVTSPNLLIITQGEGWNTVSFSGPICGIEFFLDGEDGEPIHIWVDDVSYQEPPTISGEILIVGLVALWIGGLAILFATSMNIISISSEDP